MTPPELLHAFSKASPEAVGKKNETLLDVVVGTILE